jgi:glycosyltransferase involved in cell wall biosynthesis
MSWQAVNWVAGSILGAAWLSRVVDAAIGMPQVADITEAKWDRKPATSGGEPRVSIIVPARNEAEHIGQVLAQLVTLDYSNYEIIAVNDRSTDRTGPIMDEIAASAAAHGVLKVIHVAELPPGWLGKTHAMWTATQQATGDWLLFTDADVLFRADTVRRAIAYAEAELADHVVLYPTMLMHVPGERMMMAFFQTLFVFGHRLWKVADPRTRDYIGVGAFNLVRRRVYDAVGSYSALRMEVLDDMKLGKVVKTSGYAQRGVFGKDLISLRWAKGAMGIVQNLTKNFFALLSYQWWRGIGSVIAVAFLNFGPFLGLWLAHGGVRLPYAIALISIFMIYWGMSSRSNVRPYYFFLHPVATCFFMYILLRSMFHTLWHDGVVWRGTKYPLEELKKGLV